jgi:acyl-CoA thioester hydrolase
MSAAANELEHRVQVRWQDLDGLGHVNHAVVFAYLEEGRDAFLRAHGIDRDNYVVGRCSVSFNDEIPAGETEVTVRCGTTALGRKSVTTAERIVGSGGGDIIAAEFSLVLWDPDARASRTITDAERASLDPTEVESR